MNRQDAIRRARGLGKDWQVIHSIARSVQTYSDRDRNLEELQDLHEDALRGATSALEILSDSYHSAPLAPVIRAHRRTHDGM